MKYALLAIGMTLVTSCGAADQTPCYLRGEDCPTSTTGSEGVPGESIVGEQGEQGGIGPSGPAGPQGETGPAGAVGATGVAGSDGAAGPGGPAGATGATGAAGTPAFGPSVVTNFSASRTYSPSTWSDGHGTIPAGVHSLPLNVVVTAGNSGTGWMTLTVGSIRVCYQGGAPNNSTPSTIWYYRGMRLTGNCFDSGLTMAYPSLMLPEDTAASLSINGGGCGGICSSTSTDLVVSGREFN